MLYLGDGEPDKFCERLRKLNDYLEYFPYPDGGKPVEKLPEDELIDIILNAVKHSWMKAMAFSGKDEATWETTLDAQKYFQTLYDADQQEKEKNPTPKRAGKKRKKRNDDDDEADEKPKYRRKSDHPKKEWRKKPWNESNKRRKTESQSETSNAIQKLMGEVAKLKKHITKSSERKRKKEANYSAMEHESDANSVSSASLDEYSEGSDVNDEISVESSTN